MSSIITILVCHFLLLCVTNPVSNFLSNNGSKKQVHLASLREIKPFVKHQYLVKFKSETSMKDVLNKIESHFIPVDPTFKLIHQFPLIAVINVRMRPVTLLMFRKHSQVDFIEREGIAKIAQVCTEEISKDYCATRVSNYNVTNDVYTYLSGDVFNATIYVLDSGVNISHEDFGGRASHGYNFVPGENIEDTNGHGTLCASLAIGKISGVAKQAKVVSVKVLNKDGEGNYGAIIAGMYYAAVNDPNGIMSISIGGPKSEIANNAVNNIYEFYGSLLVVSAGNDADDASNYSPASAERAFTVAASDFDNEFADDFSNFGDSVNIIAPGVECYSADFKGGYVLATGTSMSAPIVAGTAAGIKSVYTNYNGAQLASKLIEFAARDIVTDVPEDTPNLFVHLDCFQPTIG